MFDCELAVVADVLGEGTADLLPTMEALAAELLALLEGEVAGTR